MPHRHCRACNGWHDLYEPWPAECSTHFRSRGPASDTLSAPNVIMDGIEMRGMHDGKTYTSKRGYYNSLKREGLHISETPMGETSNPKPQKPDIAQDIKRAIDQLGG